MKMRNIILCLLPFLLSTSCKEDALNSGQKPQLVVEGWIDSGGFPVVMLSTTLPVDKHEHSYDELLTHVQRWAKVTVSDGTKEVILTGMRDDDFFPPYIYTTTDLRGEVGRTYTLTVDTEGYHATASTTIPAPPVITACSVEPIEGDTLLMTKVTLVDFPNERNRYCFFTSTSPLKKQYRFSYFSCLDDEVLSSETEVTLYKSVSHNWKDSHYFSPSDEIYVKACQVDSASFLFWDDYMKSFALSGNMFLTTASNIHYNVSGGIGYWCGYGARYMKLHPAP